MRLTTKIFVLLAVVAVSLFAINSGNQASADDIPAGTDVLIVELTTDFLGSQVVLTGVMTVDRQAQTGTDTIQCEIVAMQLSGTYAGIPLTVTAGSQNGISPSFCTITEQVVVPTSVLFDFLADVFLEVDLHNDGSVDAENCDGIPIVFGSTLPGVPITSQVSFAPVGQVTSPASFQLCDPQNSPLGLVGDQSSFSGNASPAAPPVPPGPPAVGGIVGISAEDGSLRASESSSSASAITLLLLSAAFVSVVALATGGWYLRRRLIP
ncbi:MAG: hypothetical protein IH957_05360 [Chloroflexi bacterium]|nr:hypothetical protein [Chloroflexota bacterium]